MNRDELYGFIRHNLPSRVRPFVVFVEDQAQGRLMVRFLCRLESREEENIGGQLQAALRMLGPAWLVIDPTWEKPAHDLEALAERVLAGARAQGDPEAVDVLVDALLEVALIEPSNIESQRLAALQWAVDVRQSWIDSFRFERVSPPERP